MERIQLKKEDDRDINRLEQEIMIPAYQIEILIQHFSIVDLSGIELIAVVVNFY
jgi:hypothetical protein